jgi:hypothetical protein
LDIFDIDFDGKAISLYLVQSGVKYVKRSSFEILVKPCEDILTFSKAKIPLM